MKAIDHAARGLPEVTVPTVPMNVGSIVPPAVKLAALPTTVAKVLAQYAGYEAFRSSQTLVIVDRSSRAIAYLLPPGQAPNAACPGTRSLG